MTKQHAPLEKTPYPWPSKDDFVKAITAYINYKQHRNRDVFEIEVYEALYIPFKENHRPASVEKIYITESDLREFKNSADFLPCIGEISTVVVEVIFIEVDHHIKNDMDFILKISLIK
ncbi:MAG: hypothetical protein JWM92_16 [Candidatus Nomurabacteria bacterium]|nr:hypothetical protein [Candidatus Nomurabacteria bacterium]